AVVLSSSYLERANASGSGHDDGSHTDLRTRCAASTIGVFFEVQTVLVEACCASGAPFFLSMAHLSRRFSSGGDAVRDPVVELFTNEHGHARIDPHRLRKIFDFLRVSPESGNADAEELGSFCGTNDHCDVCGWHLETPRVWDSLRRIGVSDAIDFKCS
ncbi:hypothetical protein, partial [Burkholderia pseudomallei]|uniref:hypothetical protein n=1 Tax=Burkholderia pseudomallei TaxID=28450 RepID=UPI004039D26F